MEGFLSRLGDTWKWLVWQATHMTLGMALWVGLVVLTIVLLVLMRTRWGQVAPLWKCAVLSVFAHILLGVYAWTTQLVFVAPHPPASETFSLTVVDPDEENESTDNATTKTRPWDEFDLSTDAIPDPASAERVTTKLQDELQRTQPHLSQEFNAPAFETPAQIDSPKPDSPAIANEFEGTTVRPVANREPVRPQDISISRDKREESDEAMGPVAESAGRLDLIPEYSAPVHAEPPNRTENATVPREAIESWLKEVVDELRPQGNLRTAPAGNLKTRPATTTDHRELKPTVNDDAMPRPKSEVAPRRLADGKPVPDLYAGRSPDERKRRATKLGGSLQTEQAVEAALWWLAANQEPEGNWNPVRQGGGQEQLILGHDRQNAGVNADSGITGLALLAFLGAGHTHLEGEHRDIVERGLEYLVRQQAGNGDLAGNARLFARMYCHAMASLALSEALATTGDPRLVGPVRRAVEYSLASQHRFDGGWRYRPGDEGDMSQFGWQVMALRSARMGGVEIPGEASRLMRQFLERCSRGSHRGLAGYQPGHPHTPTMTAEALLCRYFLEIDSEPQLITEASRYLLDQKLPGQGEVNFYYWYYATLALFHVGGAEWDTWNRQLTRTLTASQNQSGAAAGSWDPVGLWCGYGGRVYSTAMGALCLEVYYRYSTAK